MSGLTTRELQLEVQDIEIILGLLTPRATGTESDASRKPAQGPDAACVVALVRGAHDELQRRHADAEAVAGAILALVQVALGEADTRNEKAIADIEAMIGARHAIGVAAPTAAPADADGIAAFIHDLAVNGFKSGHIARAVTLF